MVKGWFNRAIGLLLPQSDRARKPRRLVGSAIGWTDVGVGMGLLLLANLQR